MQGQINTNNTVKTLRVWITPQNRPRNAQSCYISNVCPWCAIVLTEYLQTWVKKVDSKFHSLLGCTNEYSVNKTGVWLARWWYQ